MNAEQFANNVSKVLLIPVICALVGLLYQAYITGVYFQEPPYKTEKVTSKFVGHAEIDYKNYSMFRVDGSSDLIKMELISDYVVDQDVYLLASFKRPPPENIMILSSDGDNISYELFVGD